MLMDPIAGAVGQVGVAIAPKGGHEPEFWAERATQRIIAVSDNLPAPIRDQALAYQQHILQTVLHYMKEAIRSDRTTVCKALTDAGYQDLAEAVKRV